MNRYLTYIIWYMTVITAVMTSCKDDELLSTETSTRGNVFIRCASADFVVHNTNRSAEAAQYEDAIYKLDLLVYDSEGNLLRHLDVSSTQTDSLTNESYGYTWNVTGQIQEDYLRNKDYSICVIGNYYTTGKISTDFPTLSALKNYRFEGSMDSEPTYPYEAKTKGIPMIQLQESGTDKNFKTTTRTLQMDALERVMAKIEILPYIPNTITEVMDYEEDITQKWTGNAEKNWIYDSNNHYIVIRNNNQTGNRNGILTLNNNYLNATEWELEFKWANYSGNYTGAISSLNIFDSNNNKIFYTETPTYSSTTTLYKSNRESIGTLTTDAYQQNHTEETNLVKTWYKFIFHGNNNGIELTVKDSDNQTAINPTIVNQFSNIQKIEFVVARTYSQMAMDDLKMTVTSPGIQEIGLEEYRLFNYTNSYTLFNINDSDKDTTNLKVYPGLTTIPSTGFKNYASTSAMWGSDNLTLYAYPNYWFDSQYYDKTGSDGPHKEEPINYGRQTYVLVKSRYITAEGIISNKAYYYKIPINYRLPEFNDAASNATSIDNICETIYNTIYNAMYQDKTMSTDNITDTEQAAIETDFKMAFYGRTIPNDIGTRLNTIYNVFINKYTDGNKIDSNDTKEIITVIKQQICNDEATTPEAVYTLIMKTAKKEAEQFCRIQRNHHYKVNVRFDKPGGEGADEAIYIFAEPYADVIIRPEF